ncbi:MAG: FAD-binding oxidoreductase [Smithellaceae bacterium]|nr:FAD-binding oxidoreductase [Smithellaceae bacterium]
MKTRQSIHEEFGDRATSSPMERELYSRDLGPVPALMVDPLFQTMADLIVRPRTTEEVATLLRRCAAEGIPVTPRAGASTVFFNAVPVRGGVVMDLNSLNGVIAVDEAAKTVTVRAATVWRDLEVYLNARGLACKSVPSSAPVATVGGWLCMMGYGIGSLKYGSLISQVRSIEIILPDGRVQRLSNTSDPSLDWFAASEGTLGVVTEVELEIRALTQMKHFLLHIPDNLIAERIISRLIDEKIRPYNMHFSDQYFVRALKDLGLSDASINEGGLLIVDYEGPAEELSCAETIIQRLLQENPSVALMPESLTEQEWEERYKSIRIKRGGPAVLGGEMWLPVASLPAYLDDIRKMSKTYGVDLMSYGHIVSPDRATAMTLFFADETQTFRYIINLSLVKKIQDAGYRNGGSPYGVGLWNTPYLGRIFSSSWLKNLKARKQRLDPKGIMNPGKLYSAPFMLNPLNFYVGMEAFALVRRVFGKRW